MLLHLGHSEWTRLSLLDVEERRRPDLDDELAEEEHHRGVHQPVEERLQGCRAMGDMVWARPEEGFEELQLPPLLLVPWHGLAACLGG